MKTPIAKAGRPMRFASLAIAALLSTLPLAAQELEIDRPPRPENPEKTIPRSWEEVGDGLFRSEYRVPPDIFRWHANDEGPFGGNGDGGLRPKPAHTAQQLLEEVGIKFGKGASAKFDQNRSVLIVTNTETMMELVDSYLDTMGPDPPVLVAVRTEIYQLTQLQVLQLLESAASEGDHTPERNAALKAARGGKAKLVAVHSILTTSGQRTKTEDVSEIQVPYELVPKPKKADPDGEAEDEAEESVVVFEHDHYGTILEVEPNLGTDGATVSLNIAFEHHTADPVMEEIVDGVEGPRFHAKRINANCTILDGQYAILGNWKPTGKPEYANSDAMQIVFVTVNVQRVGSIGKQQKVEK